MRYQLYYQPAIQGRGEFGRLAFEDAGADYVDVARDPDFGRPGIMKFMEDVALEHPPFAPPFLTAGKLLISQTANILEFLGPTLDLMPKSDTKRIWANQLQLTIAEWLAEISQTHHPIANVLYYEEHGRGQKACRELHRQSDSQVPRLFRKSPQSQYQTRRLRFRQEGRLRRSFTVSDDGRAALCFSEDTGKARIRAPEDSGLAPPCRGSAQDCRLPVIAAAAAVHRGGHFPPLSRVGGGMMRRAE
jgi:hypothetical protein